MPVLRSPVPTERALSDDDVDVSRKPALPPPLPPPAAAAAASAASRAFSSAYIRLRGREKASLKAPTPGMGPEAPMLAAAFPPLLAFSALRSDSNMMRGPAAAAAELLEDADDADDAERAPLLLVRRPAPADKPAPAAAAAPAGPPAPCGEPRAPISALMPVVTPRVPAPRRAAAAASSTAAAAEGDERSPGAAAPPAAAPAAAAAAALGLASALPSLPSPCSWSPSKSRSRSLPLPLSSAARSPP